MVEIVVGADVEAADAIGHAIFRGQHDDRHAALGANAPADFHAVHARKHQIEDHEVGLFERLLQALEPVARAFDLVAFVLELELQHAADGGVVLDDENLEAVFRLTHVSRVSDVRPSCPLRRGWNPVKIESQIAVAAAGREPERAASYCCSAERGSGADRLQRVHEERAAAAITAATSQTTTAQRSRRAS